MTASLRSFWRDDLPIARIAYIVGALLIVSGVVHLAILIAGGGSWAGPLSWRKPATFGVSFGLTLITIVWVSAFERVSTRARGWLLAAFTLACALEVTLVSLQTWRGVPSHFNVETRIDAQIARTLAIGGGVLIVVIVTFTIAAFRLRPDVPLSLRIAIRAGFVALLAAQIVGGAMIARGMSLVFAGHPQMAYATGGAFKPIHAAAMHGIQLLPGLAWLLSFADWSEHRRIVAVSLAATAYGIVLIAMAVSLF
jgi:hypothetical protein